MACPSKFSEPSGRTLCTGFVLGQSATRIHQQDRHRCRAPPVQSTASLPTVASRDVARGFHALHRRETSATASEASWEAPLPARVTCAVGFRRSGISQFECFGGLCYFWWSLLFLFVLSRAKEGSKRTEKQILARMGP